jgi:hypothetical protein
MVGGNVSAIFLGYQMRRQKSLMYYCILSGAQRNNSVVVPHFLSIASSYFISFFFYSGCCWMGWRILWCDGSGAIDSGSGCRPLTGWDIAPTYCGAQNLRPETYSSAHPLETSILIGQHHLAVNCQGGAYFEIWTLQSFLNEHFLWTCLECKWNMTSLDGPDANLYIWILTS